MAAAPSVVPVVHGPILIGTVLNVLLYGISLTQTYFYVATFRQDRWVLKALVFVIFVADTMNSVFDVVYIYDALVLHYNDPAAIATANWVFATDPAMGSLIASMVQIFFAWRVKILTGNIWVAALLLFGSVISGLGGVATSIAIGIVPNWLEFQKFEAPVIVWLTTSAIVDVTITAFMTYHLRRHRGGFKRTDDVLSKIIRLTVQTGLITSVWAIVDLAVFLAIPTGFHLIFNFPLAKLYSNSLLSSLNARASLDGRMTTSESQGAQHKSPHSGRALGPEQIVSFNNTVRPEVYVDVESHELSDRIDSKPGDVYDGSQQSYYSPGAKTNPV